MSADWHSFFLLLPRIVDGRLMWLTMVERKVETFAHIGGVFSEYEFRRIKPKA